MPNDLSALAPETGSTDATNALGLLSSAHSGIAIPTSGDLAMPPFAAYWLATGKISDPGRKRKDPDGDGKDCNDYAAAAVQDLSKEGYKPYYVEARDEKGDWHMIAAYATRDGVTYARDSRVASGDVPLQYLVDRGYKLISAADPAAQYWYSFPTGKSAGGG